MSIIGALNEFTNNTTADAPEVNANFTAIKTAHNALETDVAALGTVGGVTDSITAWPGGTQALAVALTTAINRITTCATAGDSVKLPSTFVAGQPVSVNNDGAARADVFPSAGHTIIGLSANIAIQLLPGQSISFKGITANSTWGIV